MGWPPINPVFAILSELAVLPQLERVIDDFKPDLLHAVHVGLVYSSEMAYQAARHFRIPFVWTPFPHIEGGGWRGPRFRRLYRNADALIAMTLHEKQWLIEQGAPANRVHVIPTGPIIHPEYDAQAFRAAHGLGQAPIVLFLAQKLPYKGYRQVVEAAPLSRKVRLDLSRHATLRRLMLRLLACKHQLRREQLYSFFCQKPVS